MLKETLAVLITCRHTGQIRLGFRNNRTRHLHVVYHLPQLELLKQRRRLRAYAQSDSARFLFPVHINLHLTAFKFTKTYKTFLRFQRTLIENYGVTHIMLQLRREFLMEFSLRLPYPLKLVKIVLPVKDLVLQAVIGVLIKLGHLVLPHCHPSEIQFLTAVTDGTKISARILDLSVHLL